MTGRDPYRRIASAYDRLVEPMLSGVRVVAFDLVPPDPKWRILDVGCGTGTGLAPYVEAGCTSVGVDVSEAMLGQARRRLGEDADLRLIQGGVLPFPDGSFDLVLCSMVLHEIPREERASVLAEMSRVVAAGGRLLITDFRFGSLRGWRGPTFKAINTLVERFSGHYAGYRSFKAAGGFPALVSGGREIIEREKILSGGNVAIYVVRTGP